MKRITTHIFKSKSHPNIWIAQGQNRDICAQGQNKIEVLQEFIRYLIGLSRYRKLHKVAYFDGLIDNTSIEVYNFEYDTDWESENTVITIPPQLKKFESLTRFFNDCSPEPHWFEEAGIIPVFKPSWTDDYTKEFLDHMYRVSVYDAALQFKSFEVLAKIKATVRN